jgi:hypothetical protein
MSLLAQPTPTLDVSCKYPDPPPPFRLYALDFIPQYQIQAFPAFRPQNTVVYISTKSQAIVNYTLGPDWKERLGGRTVLRYNGTNEVWDEEDEERLSMRIIQAGGALLDMAHPYDDDLDTSWRYEQFGAFSRTKKYIFGWPDNGGLWVLNLHGLVPWEFFQFAWDWGDENEPWPAELFEYMDKEAELGYAPQPNGSFYSKQLNQAETMSEYCAELSELNATFYQDPRTSEEALEAGLFDNKTLTTHWPGMPSWMADRIADRNERIAAQCPMFSEFVDESVVASIGRLAKRMSTAAFTLLGNMLG